MYAPFQVATVPRLTTAPAILATMASASRWRTPSGATATRASTGRTARSTSTSAPGTPARRENAPTLTDPTGMSF